MAAKPLVRVVGSLNIDIVTVTPSIPHSGQTLTAISRSIGAGGKGANQAVACGRAAFISKTEQDLDVEIIGAVGADDPQFHSLLEPMLRQSGVGTSGVAKVHGAQTGTSIILVDESSNYNNSILFNPGANYDGMRDLNKILSVATATAWATASTRLPDVVVMQGEIPLETTLGLLKHFNEETNKTCVVLNPAPMFPQGIASEALMGLAVLIVNESECIQLAQSLGINFLRFESTNDKLERPQLDHIANHLQQAAGIKNVIVTLGSDGAYFAAQSGLKNRVLSAKVEKVVDTTAAGDTFAGFFAAALARHIGAGGVLQNFDLPSAVNFANLAAAKSVQHSGSMKSIPFGYDLA
ncbi:ribokinase [Penicillium canescens]|nr:ribokinase [Penicillium canescens]KAJ6154576.1 ribokinase [Penicillium canescens]